MSSSVTRRAQLSVRQPRRRGNIIILTALFIVAMVGFVALTVDTGYMYMARSELKRQVDSAALAGAGAIVDGTDVAEATAEEYLARNNVSGGTVAGSTLSTKLTNFREKYQGDYTTTFGHWDPTTRTFAESDQNPSAVKVRMRYDTLPLFFARALGRETFSIQDESIAMYRPRDIALVIDLSASMNDDSELDSISTLGRSTVETNLAQMYTELGSPKYGNILTVDPKFAVVHGQAASGNTIPHVSVEYRYNSVYVTSTKTITQVRLQFSGNNTQTINGAGLTGTFQGTGSNASKQITSVWVKSASNFSNSNPYGEQFNFSSNSINTVLKTALGLNGVAYPYNQHSGWDGYIDYCKSSSNENNAAGYRYKFGYKSLISYWLANYPSYAQTPTLWQTSAQPIGAVKDSTDVFFDFLREVPTNDRVSLTVYDSASTEAITEHSLTTDFDTVSNTLRHRQAGHYHGATNTGAGLEWAREELEQHGRVGAFKMIVLMTDGLANWAHGRSSVSAANDYIDEQVALIQDDGWPIVTIGLGSGADVSKLVEIAAATGGVHFTVPGGQNAQEYREDLMSVFKEIADKRPLQLVK